MSAHKHHDYPRAWPISERLFVWQTFPPESSTAGAGDFAEKIEDKDFLREQAEKMRPLVEQVEQALRAAAGGDTKFQVLIADPEFLRTMKALVEYQEGRGVRWFAKEQLDPRFHPTLTDMPTVLRDLNTQVERVVLEYFTALAQYRARGQEVIRQTGARDAIGSGALNAQRVLEHIQGSDDRLQHRQSVILRIIAELVHASVQGLTADEAKSFIENIFKKDRGSITDRKLLPSIVLTDEEIALFGDLKKLETDLKAAVEGAVRAGDKFNSAHMKTVLQVLQVEADLPPVERHALRKTVDDFIAGKLHDAGEPKTSKAEITDAITGLFRDLADPTHKNALANDVTLLKIEVDGLLSKMPDPLTGADFRALTTYLRTMVIDRQTLRIALSDLERRAVEAEQEQRRFLLGRFPERSRYFYLIEGGKPDLLIQRSLRSDSRVDFETMHTILGTLTPEGVKNQTTEVLKTQAKLDTIDAFKASIDAARVKALAEKYRLSEEGITELAYRILSEGRFAIPIIPTEDAAEELISIWDQRAFQTFLRDECKLENPLLIDVGGALRRSVLPPSVKAFVEERKLDISVSALHAMAKSDEVEKYPVAADAQMKNLPDLTAVILDYVAGADTVLDQGEFLGIFSFLLSPAEATAFLDALKKDAAGIMTEAADKKLLVLQKGVLEQRINEKTATMEAIQHLRALHDAKFHMIKGVDRIKLSAAELARLAGKWGGNWWDWMSSQPRHFYDPDVRREHQKLVARRKGIGAYQDLLGDVLSHFGTHKSGMERAMNTLYEKRVDVALEEYASLIPLSDEPSDRLRMQKYASIFEAKQLYIVHALKNAGFQNLRDPEERLRAIFLANQPPDVDTAIDRAKVYLQDTARFKFTEEEKEVYKRFRAKYQKVEILEGKDILKPLEELNIGVKEKALDILQNANLLVGDTAFENWLQDPAKAEEPLKLIVYDLPKKTPGGTVALIQAFCKRQVVTLPGERKLHFGEAEEKVRSIIEHLQRQRDDFQRSAQKLLGKERFKQPLDFFRAGAESIGTMLQSGDRVQQGLAITILASAGYFLYQRWKKGGVGKQLMIGLPLFFGADIVMKDMTGKGLIQRLGLTYMNPKDKNTALEQFIRRHEKDPAYKDLGTEAGWEAMRQLMDHKSPVPIADLIEWRRQARRGSPDALFSDGAPAVLKRGVSRVMSKIGSLEKKQTPRKFQQERAYEIMLLAFEALCTDVARQNEGKGTVEEGMQIIRERYVDFTAPHLKGFAVDLGDLARKKGGFSMIDVLVYEMPTPAMRDVLANDSHLEWIFRGTGISIALAKEKFLEGWSTMQIYAEHAADRAPEVYAGGKEWVFKTASDVRQWVEEVYPSVALEVRENLISTWSVIRDAATAAGLTIKMKGPDVIEWGFDTAVATGKFTLATAQSLYRELHLHQITGNAVEGLDALCRRLFGPTLTGLILLRSSAENNQEHVAKLAEYARWKEDLLRQISTIANAPTKEQVDTMVENASKVFPAEKRPHIMMAVYELVKRNLFSRIVAARMMAVAQGNTSPQKLTVKWDATDDLLAQGVNGEYGLQTLQYLGTETTLAGSVERHAASLPEGYQRSFLEFLHWSVDWATRNESTEYIVTQLAEYLHPYIEEAKIKFKDEPKKLRQYRAYLETIVTNALIELAMGAKEGDDPMPPNRTQATLMLTVAQAKNLLRYLAFARGTSADLEGEGMDAVNFDAFAREPGTNSKAEEELEHYKSSPAFMDKLRGVHPVSQTGAVAGTGEIFTPLTPAEVHALPSKIDTPQARAALLRGLQSGSLTAAQEGEKRQLFDVGIATLPTLKDAANLPEALTTYADYLRGVSPARIREVEDKLLTELSTDENMEALLGLSRVRDAEKAPIPRRILQHVLDRAVARTLDDLATEISGARGDLSKDPRHAAWKEKLIKLYAATNPATDKVTDLVSMALEYVLYQAKNSDALGGLSGLAKYETYLKGSEVTRAAGRTLIPPAESEYQYGESSGIFGFFGHDTFPSARSRMEKTSEGVTPAEYFGRQVGSRLSQLRKELGE